MTSRNKHQKRLKAVGTSLALTPAMKELRDEALVLLDSDLSDKEIISRLDKRIDESGIGVRMFLCLRRGAGRRGDSCLTRDREGPEACEPPY